MSRLNQGLPIPIPSTFGGTGVSNAAANTITLGGAVVFSGAFAATFTFSNTTNSTFPAGTHSLAPLDSPSFTTPTLGDAVATSVTLGTASAQVYNFGGSAATPSLQANNTAAAGAAFGTSRWTNSASSPSWIFLKSRGAAVGTLAAVNNGDSLGALFFNGDDGATAGGISVARIVVTATAGFSSGSGSGKVTLQTRKTTGALGDALTLTEDQTVQVASGKIFQLGNAATTGLAAGVLAALTNSSIVITDSTGQAYRIPCII